MSRTSRGAPDGMVSQWSGTAPEFRHCQQAGFFHIAFSYSAGMSEVLAGQVVCPDLHVK